MESKVGCPLSANSKRIFSAILSQAPCGLFSAAYHFFSEPGSTNDNWGDPRLYVCQALGALQRVGPFWIHFG